MKKPKLKFSKQGITDFLFRHSEKLVFALSVGLIGLFFWLGFSTPSYDETSPGALLQKSRQAGDYINDSGSWERIAEYRQPVTDAAERIAMAQPVSAESANFRYLLAPQLRTLEKRTDPVFLKPGELHLSYLRAQMAKKSQSTQPSRGKIDQLPNSVLKLPESQLNEMFVHRIKNQRAEFETVDVVVGMALVDYEAQLEAYRETLQYQRGFDVDRDVPELAFIEVQRRTGEGEWEPITDNMVQIYDKIGLLDNSVAPPRDVIPWDPDVDAPVTYPIPPLLGIDYREFATLPGVKTVAEKMAEDKKKEEEKKNEEKNNQGGGLFDTGGKSDKEAKSKDESEAEEAPPKYRLIRFYDIAPKEPGVKFSYRVRVWFVDPNNPDNFTAAAISVGDAPTRGGGGGGGLGQDTGDGSDGGGGTGNTVRRKKKKAPLLRDDLSPEVRTRLAQPAPEVKGLPQRWVSKLPAGLKSVVPGEWVESTSTVQATRGFETFAAGPVDAPPVNTVGDIEFYEVEPEATVVVQSFLNDLDVFVPATTQTLPGSLLNFRAVTNVLHPVKWQILELRDPELQDRRGRKLGRQFETEAVLVDVMGGEKQPFSRKPDNFLAPADVLILDRNGKLIVRNDIEDETTFRHANFVSADNLKALEDSKNDDKDDKDDDDDPSR